MGGKHKGANRTKNNARPSNSGRSAELLGTSIPQFVGFTGIKDTAFGFSLTNTDDIDTSLDPNIQVIFKKISKRDSTTKIKGLQELATFVKESDTDTVKTILPMWPRFFTVLATDTDNRVREATQNTHHQIILKVKRNIAPYLKQLIAPWFTSQYDTYPPAASIAQQAFTDAFPPNKIQEAIAFCQEEILNYLSDNLLVQTAQTLSNLKNLSTEEAEAKYERILISCLQGYCLYLEKVSVQQIKNAVELNTSIISNQKFWKFSKSKVAHVKASFFKIVSVLCQKASFLIEDKGSSVVGSVFSNLDEYDPTVLPRVWEAALLTMSTVKEWWTFINIEKLFLSKLWKILKQGGQGNATVIYPSLLPLISCLPPNIEKTVPQFYNIFFENLWTGLKQKSTLSSRSESVAVATSYIECLQYVILKKQSNLPFCKTLIKNNLLTSIEWCLTEDQTNYKTLFNQISSLIQHWSRNEDSDAIKSCIEFFLDNVKDLFRDTLFNIKETPCYDVNKVAEKQLDFLQSLKCITKHKKQFKVKFNTDSEINDHKLEQSATITDDKVYMNRLNNLAYNICEDYVQYVTEKKSKILIEHLYSLVIDFDTRNFFENLNDKMKLKNKESKLMDIFTTILEPWLKSEELCCKHVVSLIFLLLEYVDGDDKTKILNVLLEVPDNCLSWCIGEALAHPHNKELLVKEWLRSERISNFIISITDKIILDECPPDLSALFKLALTENVYDELLINSESLTSIISKLINTIQNYTEYTVTADTCASLLAYISTVIYTDNLQLTYKDTLLISLFHLSCNPNIDNEIISEETMYEVTTSWQDALTLLSKCINKESSLQLAAKLADIIREEFNKSTLNEENINHFIKVVICALSAIYKSLPLNTAEFLDVFTNSALINSLHDYVEDLCVLSEYINGNLNSAYKEINLIDRQVERNDIGKYFAWIYFKMGVIGSNLKDVVPEDDYDDSDNDNNESKEILIMRVIDNAETYITTILKCLCLCQSYLDYYSNTPYYDAILHYYILTDMKFKTVLKSSDETFKMNIKRILKEKSIKGWFWAKAIYLFYSEIHPEDLPSMYEEFVKNCDDLSALHLTQIFKKHLTYDNIQNKFDTIGDVIVLNSLIHCDEIDVQIAEVFNKTEKIRSQNVPQFLYNSDKISWRECQEIIEIIRLCSSLMKTKFECLNQKYWDFGVISLVSWASNCLKARSKYETYQFQALLCAVVNLYVNTDKQISSMKKDGKTSDYINEWEDVLVESVHNDLLQLWLYLGEQLKNKEEIITYLPLIQEFHKIIPCIKSEKIFKGKESLPKWPKYLKQSCELLTNKQPQLQLWGYKMLHILVPGLIKIDTQSVKTNSPHEKGLIFEQFKEKLMDIHEIVNNMLMGFKLGEDGCRVEPMTDSFTYVFAYLLLWDVLLTLCDGASPELKFQYADWLRNEDFLGNLLTNLFKLMPAEVLHSIDRKSDNLEEVFWQTPVIEIKDSCDSEKIEQLVCWLYFFTLAQLPALVRQWVSSLDSRMGQIVERITQHYVSKHLIMWEMQDLFVGHTGFKNMALRVSTPAREIIATYTVDEAQVELVITLPPNYPLGSLDVQCNNQIAGASQKQWLLQFKKCVIHQNGRIWDGLSLWNKNLDKKFEGVEECYVCFAVLHAGTYQLPKLACQTCKKKFHSACLYKWFRTSYKSSCPICRNLF